MNMAEKKYGLIKPQNSTKRLLAFASDSESDEETTAKKISISENVTQKRQARLLQLAAQKEDPTIFQYDEVYDEMSAKRENERKSMSNVNRESKYVSKLLVTAKKRKIEHEGRIERKMQRERETEGDQFKDKEVFVTAAYRQKLEILKKNEDEARREDYLESIGDVLKQKDLSGFYRHIYEQKISVNEDIKNKEKASRQRVYRKRSENLDEDIMMDDDKSKISESAEKKKTHLQSNLDADSDFDIDSSDSEKPKAEVVTENDTISKDEEKKSNVEKVGNDEEKIDRVRVISSEKESQSIWKKRTVGDVYNSAVKRYFERTLRTQATIL